MRICLSVIFILSMLSGCDWLYKRELKQERADKQYQSAMADYAAGRINAAIRGFEKALASNPGNSSARFQLASILQDSKADYLGSICHYREYLMQDPSSDKATLAKERLHICEKMLANQYAEKLAAANDDSVPRETYEALQKKHRQLTDEFAKLLEQNQTQAKEMEALRKIVARFRDEDSGSASPRPIANGASPDVATLLDQEDEPQTDKFAAARKLLEEATREDSRPVEVADNAGSPAGSDSSALLPQPAAKHDKNKKGPSLFERNGAKSKNTPIEKPEYYVVEDGDTLYKIANRFYGKTSSWKQIREANKAIISIDGRVKAGQRIRLP